jgi:hypothetical protein
LKNDFNGINYELNNNSLSLDTNADYALGNIGGVEYPNKKEFDWNNKKYVITFNSLNHILINGQHGTTSNPFKEDTAPPTNDAVSIDYSLAGYSTIKGISFLPYPKNSNNSSLFVLAQLSVVSSKSVLLVFSDAGEIVYEELLDASDIIEIGKTNNNEDAVILGSSQIANQKIQGVTIKDYIYKIKK